MLYKKVMQALKARIDSDEFNVGDMLPTEKNLIEQYSVSRITIRKAVDELVKSGLISKRQGAGSTVIGKTVTSSMSNLRSTNEYMAEYGVNLEYKLVEFKLTDPDEKIASLLEIARDEKIYFIRRFMILNGVPAIYEDSYMPMKLYPQMNFLSLEGSKYDYLEKELGFEIDGALQDYEAIMPDADMREVLGLPEGVPLIRLQSVGKLKDGRVFELTRISFKPNTHSFKHYLKR